MEIREARGDEAAGCMAIYNHWVRHSTASFDVEERDGAATASWYAGHRDPAYPLLVAVAGGAIVGWGTLSRWSARTGYRPTAEISIFVHPDSLRAGAGRRLGLALLERARDSGRRVVVARLTSDNEPSRRLFAGLGFEPVGVMRAVGYKFGRWLDVLIMQCDLGAADAPPSAG